MYYDVNVSSNYLKQDVDCLRESEYQGICMNTVIKARNFRDYIAHQPNLDIEKSIYSRLEIEFEEGDQINYEQSKAMKSDLLVIKLSSVTRLDKLIKLRPDMITFNYTAQPLPFKPGLVRTAIKENIFFEVQLREGLYRGSGSVMWMRNVRRLLSITNGRNIVISSGATCFTEVKRPKDIIKMLEVFGIRRKRAEVILGNSGRLLRSCAVKRYCHKGMIVHSGDEGALKRDFILGSYLGTERFYKNQS